MIYFKSKITNNINTIKFVENSNEKNDGCILTFNRYIYNNK